MERQAPRQVMYENQLPLAIESKSTRRLFFPEGGSEYGPTGNGSRPNIIRIPINADSLLDVQHSFLQFKLTNTDGTKSIAPDFGVPFIRRLRIESAGTTLEDIEEYGKLYGGVLFPSQASVGAVQDSSITTSGVGDLGSSLSAIGAIAAPATAVTNAEAAAIVAGAGGEAAFNAKIDAAINRATADVRTKLNARTITGASTLSGVKHSIETTLGAGKTATYNVPLVSALMNMDKYLPLVMMNAGLTLELELDVANSIGVTTADPAAGFAAADAEWKISDVRYVAHLIDLQRDFYDKMRMVMEGSGGVLQLAGSTFRHYGGTSVAADQEMVVNIPSRVKSIKSVFFTQQDNSHKAANNRFGVSESIPNNISEYQFRIGSVLYPSTSVKLDGVAAGAGAGYTNKGEAYSELRKAFGNLGDYSEGGVLLNKDTYFAGTPSTKTSTAFAANGQVITPSLCPLGLDFEAFPKTALESGVNTADRSLPMSLEIKKHSGAGLDVNVDVWVMCDAIFYVNLDGSVSVSI